MHRAVGATREPDAGVERHTALGCPFERDADLRQRAGARSVVARRDHDRAGTAVHETGADVTDEETANRAAVRRADDDGGGVQLLGELVQRAGRRAIDDIGRDLVLADAARHDTQPALRVPADVVRVLGGREARRRFARQGRRKCERRRRQPSEAVREGERGGVVVAQCEADDDGWGHGGSRAVVKDTPHGPGIRRRLFREEARASLRYRPGAAAHPGAAGRAPRRSR